MEFDKSRVYTAVNADELKVSSKVIVADNLKTLKKNVATGEDIKILGKVWVEDFESRFEVVGMSYRWLLAYLVSEPEEKILKWTELSLGDIIRRKDNLREGVVTLIDKNEETELHINVGEWIHDDDLIDWEKVED